MWGWSYDQMKGSVEAFEKQYPQISVKFVNTGTAADHMTKFQNAVSANKGVPDVVQFGYDTYSQYAVNGSLLNFKSSEIEKEWGSKYNSATWDAVHLAGGLYGTPQDQAPIAMYVRQDVLDKYNLKTPTTWDEFYEEGVKLHKADSSKYMGFIDTAGSRQWYTMYRQAEAQLWSVKGAKDISLDFESEAAKKVTEYIQKAVDNGVLEAVNSGTDEFNRDVANGRYATQYDENWRGALIENMYPSLAGKYKVALPPSWGSSQSDLKTASGGSMLSVSAACPKDKQAAALAFIDWINSNQTSIDAFQKANGTFFMAANSYQDAAKKKSVVDKYFNQDVNKVYFASADKVNGDWTYLPFMSQLDSSFTDVVVPSLKKGGDLSTAVASLQTKISSFAKDQGFNVEVVDK
jgi:multiple sugar transport system substrate-binding protein